MLINKAQFKVKIININYRKRIGLFPIFIKFYNRKQDKIINKFKL